MLSILWCCGKKSFDFLPTNFPRLVRGSEKKKIFWYDFIFSSFMTFITFISTYSHCAHNSPICLVRWHATCLNLCHESTPPHERLRLLSATPWSALWWSTPTTHVPTVAALVEDTYIFMLRIPIFGNGRSRTCKVSYGKYHFEKLAIKGDLGTPKHGVESNLKASLFGVT